MPHSTHLQNLTHADIIRIGAAFEDDLRNELAQQAGLDLVDKLAEQDVKHQMDLQEVHAEHEQQLAAHEVALLAKESQFSERLEMAKKTWREELKGEIEKEAESARLKEKELARAEALKESEEVTERVTKLRNEFEREKEMSLESQRRQTQAEFGQARATLVSDLAEAKRAISKLKYSESERAEYVDELIKDIKETSREKFEAEQDELRAEFESERFSMRQAAKQLAPEGDEARQAVVAKEAEIEAHKRKYVELKNQFQTFVIQTRPDLTAGQIDFMFEF